MKPVTRIRWTSVVFTMLLMYASVVTAQTIDPRMADFAPSADHSGTAPDGSPLVQSYQIEFYLQGAPQPFQSASLGKPAPDPDGRIRVDLTNIFLGWPLPGTVYTSTVAAVGPGGATRSAQSNAFSFSGPCSYTVSPTSLNSPATAGSGSTGVSTAGACSWTATSNASWLTITNGASGNGNGTVAFSIAANAGTTSRTGTLTVAGQTVAVTQQGVSAPNQAPTLTQPANQTSAEGTTVSLQLAATDPDGNALTYSATGLPASLSINPASGLISGTLTFTSAGTYTVTATASDGALTNSKTFTWTVTDVGPPSPSLTGVSPVSGVVGTSVTITGANFGATQGTSSIQFNGTTATPTSWSAGTIVAAVPGGATSGPVVVTVGGVASNGLSFTVSPPGNLPAPWTSQDVSTPAVPGQATYASGTFAVSGAGTDIWGTSDEFRFTYRALTGDGEIIARVDSLQYTDTWAKAGVMVREDLAADAPNVVAQVTASQGPTFQWRGSRGGASAFTNGFQGAAPQWVRLVRTGHTFRGYHSSNGTAWTLMGTSTVVMAAQVYVGLAVTSHNASVATTATFTNVSVTGGVSPCTFSVSPTTLTVVATGGAQTAAVTATVGCSWTAASSASWLAITNGASGSGNGAVAFSIAPNSGISRTGTLTIAGQTLTVTQQASSDTDPPPPPGNLRIR